MKAVKKFLKAFIIAVLILFIAIICFIIINNIRANSIFSKVKENEDLTFKVTLTYSYNSQPKREIYNSKDMSLINMDVNNENNMGMYYDKKTNANITLYKAEDKKLAFISYRGINMTSFNNLGAFEMDSYEYMRTVLKNDFSIKNLLLCAQNFFYSAKWISEETINGVECYKITTIWPYFYGNEQSIYISKYNYMTMKATQGKIDGKLNTVDYDYEYEIDMSKLQIPDLTDYYVVIQ